MAAARFRILIPIALALVSNACVRQEFPAHEVTADLLPAGVVDAPRDGATVTEPFSVVGWAINETGIDRVVIYVDRRPFLSVKPNKSRPDVAKAFPNYPDAATSGFEAPMKGLLIVGGHEILVQAVSRTGARRDIGTVRINLKR